MQDMKALISEARRTPTIANDQKASITAARRAKVAN